MKKSLIKVFLLLLSVAFISTLVSCNYEGGQDWITDTVGHNCILLGHKWDEGVITKPATKDNEGEKTFTCQICSEHKNEVIPMIEVADTEIYEVDGVKYVNYGSYPQTHIGNESLIIELNKLTETNDRGYYEYNGKEYAKIITTPYQYSLVTDTSYYLMYKDGTKVLNNVIEWFIVEPIKWRVISENSDGSVQIYSEYLLDATSYYDSSYSRTIDGVEVYRNNYKYSNVRAWLNGYNGTSYDVIDYTNKGFYNLAFKDNEKGTFITKEVDNSASTTEYSTNQHTCENTFDKLYLLSYKDLQNLNYGFTDDLSRCAKVTDYAKAVGAYWDTSAQYWDNNLYWLRSPSSINRNEAYFINSNGNILNYYTSKGHYGVRVACNIYIK